MASFADDFNRADSSTLGSNWTVSTGLSSFQITSNAARGTSGASLDAVSTGAATFTADQEASVKYTARGSFDFAGPAVRIASSAATGYAVYADGVNSSDRRLVRVTGQTRTAIGTAAIVPVAGDVVKLRVVGTTLTVYVNGSLVDTVTDSTYASGQPGMYYLLDNVSATRLDDFIADDVGLPPSSSPVPAFGRYGVRGPLR